MRKQKRRTGPLARGLALAAVLGIGLGGIAAGPGVAADDLDETPVFRAMKDELVRSMSRLKMEDLDGPYYLEYIVRDVETATASASFGGLTASREGRTRTLSTDLRVGSYEFDNTNYAGDPMSLIRSLMGGGGGLGGDGGQRLAIDDDYEAIRHALWLATDGAYKSALESLADKQAMVKSMEIQDRPDDFVEVEPTEHVGPLVKLDVDRKSWEEAVRKYSALFREFEGIQTSSVTWTARATNQYFVNSEGSRHRQGHGLVTLAVSASAQAEDGMQLGDSMTIRRPLEKGLPSAEEITEKIREFARTLTDLASAAEPEDYTGPVLFEGGAAGELFQQLLVQGISNPRIPLMPEGGRFGGLGDMDDAKLARKVGQRILPKDFTVVDDPTLAEWEGEPLLGHYAVDDEGVVPKRVELVKEGTLETLLMSRVPTREVSGSNGHGRGGAAASGAPGNVIISSSEARSDADLKQALLDLCKEEGLEYGLLVRRNISGMDGGRGGLANLFGGGRRRGRGGFGGGFGRGGGTFRLVAYRVYVEDGREEPVRGLGFEALSPSTLRDIVAAGETKHVGHSGGSAPASICAPSVIVEELDLRKPPPQTAKKPYMEKPEF